MKKIMLYVLVFAIVLAINGVLLPKASVADLTPDSAAKAKELGGMGILKGSDSGDFLLDKTLTRDEAATIVTRLAGYEGHDSGTDNIFRDVPGSHWARRNINTAYTLGLVNGVGVSTFEPSRVVSAEEFCTMLMRTVCPDATVNLNNAFRYFAGYTGINQNTAKKMTENKKFLRSDMVDMLYAVAKTNYISSRLSPVLTNETYTGYDSQITVQTSGGRTWSYSVSDPNLLEKAGETSENITSSLKNTTYTFRAKNPGTVNVTFTEKTLSGAAPETRVYTIKINDLGAVRLLPSKGDKVRAGETRIVRLRTNSPQPNHTWARWISDVAIPATPLPDGTVLTIYPRPIIDIEAGYLLNCVLSRTVTENGVEFQEYIMKTYQYGTALLRFTYVNADTKMPSSLNPAQAFNVFVN